MFLEISKIHRSLLKKLVTFLKVEMVKVNISGTGTRYFNIIVLHVRLLKKSLNNLNKRTVLSLFGK